MTALETNAESQPIGQDQAQAFQARLQASFWQRAGGRPRVLILGAGYAGLKCALGLRGANAEVTLVNPNDYHYLTTLLHEPAVGRRKFNEATVDLPSLLEGSSIRFVKGEAARIDLERQLVHLEPAGDAEALPYDFLVVALGSKPEFHNIPGLEEHAWTLNNWSEATRLKLRVEEMAIDYKEHPDERWRAHIVVGGAGLTGVELAGELADWCAHLSKQYGIPNGVFRITLVNGSATVLAACQACQDRIIPLATGILKRKGIEILNQARVQEIGPHHVALGQAGKLLVGLIVWTGGVRGHPLIEACGLAINHQKRALVNEHLQAQDHPEVFVVGDCSAGADETGAVLPPTAQVAVHQGSAVAENFQRLLACRPLQSCAPKLMGTFLSLGHKDALGVIQNKYHFSGWTARTLKNLIAYRYLASLGGWRLVWAKLSKPNAPVRAVPPKRFFAKRALSQRPTLEKGRKNRESQTSNRSD